MKQRAANFRNNLLRSLLCSNLVLLILGISSIPGFAGEPTKAPARWLNLNKDRAIKYIRNFDFESLRLTINDLIETFGREYPKGGLYLEHLDSLRKLSKTVLGSFDRNNNSPKVNLLTLANELEKLRCDSLLSNPLLDFDKLLLLKRKRGQLGLPVNHKCNTGIERTGYDNEIAILEPIDPDGKLRTLYRPAAGEFVGEIDLHYDADKLLFTMPKGPTWQIFEIRTDGPGLSLAEPEQPAVRVSWQRAMGFCRWISQETGMNFTLPTEAQWEYACRAGLQSPLSYGEVDADFSQWANVVDSNERKANCFIISAIRMASL